MSNRFFSGAVKYSVMAGISLLALPWVYAGVEISELMAKNESGITTAAGAYADWVEIHNNSGGAEDLAGWYLTDDPSDLRKWQFPSTPETSSMAGGAYLIVFADDSPDAVVDNELHASFKLGSGGEYLALVEPDGETVAYQYAPEFPEQTADISYGIDPSTGMPAYFASPTPGTANGQAISDAITFSAESSTFTAPFDLVLSVPSPGTTEIRYTLDGSEPTSSSILYTGTPISISVTSQVRARSFTSGLVDGPIRSETFFHLAGDAMAFQSEIPVVVIDNFGAGEVPHPDEVLRQPCQVMIFEPVDGVCTLTNGLDVASRAGIKRRGESTLRNTANKPNLSLETWGEVDEEDQSIRPLGMPAESDWILYAPWTIDTAMIRNPFIYEISNEAGSYAVRTRFVEVFLNYDDAAGSISKADDYYGVYVLMEKIKQGPDRVDVADLPDIANTEPDITGGFIWKLDKAESVDDVNNFAAAGKALPANAEEATFQYVSPSGSELTETQKNWLIDHLNSIDALIPNGNYEALIDVESFADHHILNVFANNADGLRVSTFYHKDRNGVVKMGPIWDFDRSMGCDIDARASDPEVWSLATDTLYFFHNGGPLWFRDLALNDPEFWIVWTDRWQAMREGPLSDAAMDERIERYRTELSAAALRNYEKWGILPSPSDWSAKVDVMKNHVLTRGQWIDEQLIDPPVLNHTGGQVASGFQLTASGPQTQYITLDGSDPRAVGGSPSVAAYSGAITITENTLVQCRSWNGGTFVNAPNTWPWSALREVMLVVDPAPLAITEIMYHPRPPSGGAEAGYTASDFEFLEIQNTGASACSLVGVRFLDGVTFDFTYGNATTLGAGAYGVVVRNLDAFKTRYSNWASLNILGTFTGRLSNSSEELELGYTPTNMLPLVSFDYEDDWYPCTDGEGFALVLEDPQSDPATWDRKQAWRPSSAPDGTPGEANPAPAHPQGTVVVNEVLTHQDTDNPGDWIELHNTSGSSVDIGGWFLSDSRGNLMKYEIPAGTSIPANGYIVFNEHDHFGTAFALSEHGDSVYLSAGGGGSLSVPAYREFQDFGAQDRDVTFGRHLRNDGSTVFPTMAAPTMGAANTAPQIGPLVFDEIMYHPPTNGHEYVELLNNSLSTVELYDSANPSNTWKVSGIGFTFPMGVQLDAGKSLLLVRDTVTPAQFRSIYSVPSAVQIYSYSGAMDNDADTLVLRKPGAPEAATGFVPYIDLERVKYNDSAPWPAEADGLGKALFRISRTSYANDVSNWMADDASYAPVQSMLVIHSGSGDGAYAGGTVVPFTADAPAGGQTFVKWIGNVAAVTDVNASSTTLTMPGQDTTITAVYTSQEDFVTAGSTWKYHDQGSDLGTDWRSLGYNDSSWSSGPAQLGYGDDDEVTVVSYGGDKNNKYVTTYFRQSFTVVDPAAVATLELQLLRDDGAVVYINGVEIARDRMGTGPVDYLTLSPEGPVGGAGEDTFYPFAVSPSVLTQGVNVIAVEIHQQAGNSSDISFDASLTGMASGNSETADGDDDGMYDA
jgi:hypothetical protein